MCLFSTLKLLSDYTFSERATSGNISADGLETNKSHDFMQENNYFALKSLGSENTKFNFCFVVS